MTHSTFHRAIPSRRGSRMHAARPSHASRPRFRGLRVQHLTNQLRRGSTIRINANAHRGSAGGRSMTKEV